MIHRSESVTNLDIGTGTNSFRDIEFRFSHSIFQNKPPRHKSSDGR